MLPRLKAYHIPLDPFTGSGTAGVVACKNNRKFIGIELVDKYRNMAQCRIDDVTSQGNIFDMIESKENRRIESNEEIAEK